MYGAHGRKGKPTKYVQEGRFGYEEYAAKGFQLWGFNTDKASMPEPYQMISIYGIDVPHDSRDPRKLKAHNYVVTESFALDGIELNWDLVSDTTSSDHVHTNGWMKDVADNVYMAQVRRFEETGILTARTEHQLDQKPYFVYDTVYTDGFAWNTITESGKYVPQFAAIATKGALGMWALWKTPYTDLLFDAVSDLNDPKKGFYEGRYENGKGAIKTFTSNNNGILLESLLYKVQGKLLTQSNRQGVWEKAVADPFSRAGKCLPGQPRPKR